MRTRVRKLRSRVRRTVRCTCDTVAATAAYFASPDFQTWLALARHETVREQTPVHNPV